MRSVTSTTNSLWTQYNYHYDYGVVGYTQSEQKVNLYNRYIDLFAYEISRNEGAELKMVWKAYVKSQGYLDNLYKVFPAMTYTLSDYIGTTTADGWRKVYDDVQNSCSDYYDIAYIMFKERNLHSKNLVLLRPSFVGNKVGIKYICYDSNSTFVRIYLRGKTKWFKNVFIESNYQKYYCEAVKTCSGIELPMDNNVFNKYWVLDFYFPPLPEDANVIDIISQKKENKSSKDDIVIRTFI